MKFKSHPRWISEDGRFTIERLPDAPVRYKMTDAKTGKVLYRWERDELEAEAVKIARNH